MSVNEVPESGGPYVENKESDRRGSARYAFCSVAEVMDRRTGAGVTVRIADISREGCYADAVTVFPAGTEVIVSIRHEDLEFKAAAAVAYALPSMGMGIYFKELAPQMGLILEKWIREAQGEFSIPFSASSDSGLAPESKSTEQTVLCRLLELLMRKKLVTASEGSALLEELLRER